MNDVIDILVEDAPPAPKAGPGRPKKVVKKVVNKEPMKRPEGMHRELFALLSADGGKNMIELAPVLPTDTKGGYKRKISFNSKKVTGWKWTPFTNPARKDNAVFCHWRKVNDEQREYPFAKFNKEIPMEEYTDSEYILHLETGDGWTKASTDHLFDLCRRFDLRFTVIQDRWDSGTHGQKSIEDLKERYYNVSNILAKVHAKPGVEPKMQAYDAEHEKRRKEQLKKLWNRTPEQIEEEEFLRAELKKIEVRKREREKKTQDLQKLISAADSFDPSGFSEPVEGTPKACGPKQKSIKTDKSQANKKTPKAAVIPIKTREIPAIPTDAFLGIRWPDFKTAGCYLRSQKMKLPATVGLKKLKAIDQILNQVEVECLQPPTEDITSKFNELRSDIVLLYELKSALATCEMELQSLSLQHEVKNGKKLDFPERLLQDTSKLMLKETPKLHGTPAVKAAVASTSSTPLSGTFDDLDIPKKRKAALEQGNVLRKLKQKVP